VHGVARAVAGVPRPARRCISAECERLEGHLDRYTSPQKGSVPHPDNEHVDIGFAQDLAQPIQFVQL
jgi:hypothetical protein